MSDSNLEDVLQTIKPKRLYEDKTATIFPDKVILRLGATTVVAPATTGYPACRVFVKELYNGDFDNAARIELQDYVIPELDWQTVTINAQDVSVFSAIAAAGEDTFYSAKLNLTRLKFTLAAGGWRYLARYSIPKCLSATLDKSVAKEVLLDVPIDWQVFYYLFQMFKHLSGKKLDKLSWCFDKGKLYLSNEDKSYYVVVDTDDRILKSCDEGLKTIIKWFDKFPQQESSTVSKKTLGGDDSFVKHLTRPLPDNIHMVEYDSCYKYGSDYYSVFYFKEKAKDE